jgi:hypothetical protein
MGQPFSKTERADNATSQPWGIGLSLTSDWKADPTNLERSDKGERSRKSREKAGQRSPPRPFPYRSAQQGNPESLFNIRLGPVEPRGREARYRWDNNDEVNVV